MAPAIGAAGPERKISVGGWRLVGNSLVPKKSSLVNYCAKLASLHPEDPLITFRFTSSPDRVTIHKSRLTMAGGPLSALVNSGFVESSQSEIRLSTADSPRTFAVLRSFLYLQPIDLSSNGTVDVALAAHRWALDDLFNAFFLHARVSGVAASASKVLAFLPVLRRMAVPHSFRVYLAVNVARHFPDLMELMHIRIVDHCVVVDRDFVNTADKPLQHPKHTLAVSICQASSTDGAAPHAVSEVPLYPPPRSALVGLRRETSPELATSKEAIVPLPSSKDISSCAREKIQQSSSSKPGVQRSLDGLSQEPNVLETKSRVVEGTSQATTNIPNAKRSLQETYAADSLPKRPKLVDESNAKNGSNTGKGSTSSAPTRRVESMWEILQSQNMLTHVFHYVSRYSKVDYCPLFLDVILRQLEPQLKDLEVLSLLRHLDWEGAGSVRAITKATTYLWSPRAFQLLAVAQASLLTRGDTEIRPSWLFEDVGKLVGERPNIMIKSDSFAYKDHKFYLSVCCGDCSPTYMSPLIIRMLLVPSAAVPLEQDVMVWARVRAIENGCGCEGEHDAKRCLYRGIVARQLHNAASEPIPLSKFAEGSGEPFVLLDSLDFKHWLSRHRPSCSLHVQVQLRFRQGGNEYESQGRKVERGSNCQQRAIMAGRMIADCVGQSPLCSCGQRHSPGNTDEDEDSDRDSSENDGESDVHFVDDSDGDHDSLDMSSAVGFLS